MAFSFQEPAGELVGLPIGWFKAQVGSFLEYTKFGILGKSMFLSKFGIKFVKFKETNGDINESS
jgi:hypothetical protein